MLTNISQVFPALLPRRKKLNTVQALNTIFQDHEIDVQTDGSKLFILDTVFYPGGRSHSYWIDATGWSLKQAKNFLGY